jgi:glutamate dehydrogenase
MAHSVAPATDGKSLVRSTLSRWRGNLPADRRNVFVAFVDEALNRLRGPFLAQHPPTEILELLEEAFGFAQQREPGQVHTEIRPRPTRGGVAVLVNMDDQPFIVDTIRLFLRTRESQFWGGFNLVFRCVRDGSGRIVEVGTEEGQEESIVLYEAETADLAAPGAAEVLARNLVHARAMVRDFAPMLEAVRSFADATAARPGPDAAETAAFLHWLAGENFVFLGLVANGRALGIQTLAGSPLLGDPSGDWAAPHQAGAVKLRKSKLESPVHRAGRIDEILVTVDGVGSLFLRGLFTYRAITQPSRHVPILRQMLATILAENVTTGPGSFRHRGYSNVFDSLPTEFLLTATRQAVSTLVERVFEAEQQQSAGVNFLMNTPDTAFCLCTVPKAEYGDDLRRQMEDDIVAATRATYCDHGVFVGRYDTVLVHFFLTGVTDPGKDGLAALSARIQAAATPWGERLHAALAARHGDAEADRLTDTWSRAFPDTWADHNSVERTVRDIELLEKLTTVRRVQADVYREGRDLILRVYQHVDVYLSALLPVLTNFGIEVIDSVPTQVHSTGGGSLHIDTFRLAGAQGIDAATLLERGPLFTEALGAVFGGGLSDDRLNGLVLVAGLSAAQVDVLRGYMRYSRQVGMKLAILRMTEIFLANPICTGALMKSFAARFDPDLVGDRAAAMRDAAEVLDNELRFIQAHDEDLLLQAMKNLIEATIRTNAYRTDRKGAYVSFKFDASKVKSLGKNRPMFEIYVHSRDVEGVHLRFGMVARGGLRWSDRDDYRTEVLGLVTTQRVKNVVIVPTGSKGGFFLKNAARDLAERRRQADELYKTFIRGLLDVTDNSVDGAIVPPPRVVRHDGDDPYLVVAADKGTAHLSDTANGLSKEYGFWLGDAFASGGSVGYDHKKVGITARGGWVLVKRHFAEMGVDPYTQDVTCVGIGDMGGDVFGNGLIESKHLKLLAAFNHLHIFLDPNPDPARSYEERLRLFKAVGGWDKYDKSLISQGGGVFDRRAKSVPLSPEAQAMLGIDAAEAQPEVVMNAILRMKVDLFWNGGIGTYVRASWETDADADDRSNDALRVSAAELNCKVVGEGGNLGFTQQARIEAGLRGIRLNNDAVDNSGGVDLSDHEVNLKILLSRVVARGELTTEQRNVLLEQMTPEVADLVLADNDAHGRQHSRDQIRSARNLFQFGQAIALVEREFGRDRASLDLPSDEELARRSAAGLGLTRPELSVLSSWVKMYVKRELLKADPKQIPGFDELLVSYFPQRIRETYLADIRNHMLAKEIGVTVAITRMFADAGCAYFPAMIDGVGATPLEVTQAYLRAQRVANVDAARASLEAFRADGSLGGLYQAWVELDRGARDVAMFWLSSAGKIPADDQLVEMRGAAKQVLGLRTADVVAKDKARRAQLTAQGLDSSVIDLILEAGALNLALAAWAESKRSGTPIETVATRQLAVGRASGLQAVLDDLATRPSTGRWDPIAMRILHTRFQAVLRMLGAKCQVTGASVEAVEQELTRNRLREVRQLVDEVLGAEQRASVATLLVLEERVAAAAARL